MKYWSLLKDAWAALRNAPSLWALGLVTAASSLALMLIGSAISLVAVLPFAVIVLDSDPSLLTGSSDVAVSDLYTFLDSGLVFVGNNMWLINLLLAAAVTVWFVLALLEITVMGGLVTQVDASDRGEKAGARVAMADGTQYWWRTAAIWALAILPQLIYALLITVVMWFTIASPLLAGEIPNLDLMTGTTMFTQPIGMLASVAGLALGVLVAIALRYGLVDDLDWRSALSSAWRFVRTDFKRTATMFGVLWILSWAVGALTGLVQGIILIAVGVIGIFGFTAGWTTGMAAGVVALAVLMMIVASLVQASLTVYKSAAWTVFWRRATQRA